MTDSDTTQQLGKDADSDAQALETTAHMPAVPTAEDEELPPEFLEKLKANKRKRRVRMVVAVAVVAALVAAGVAAFLWTGSGSETAKETTGTYTQQVTQGDLDLTIEGSGTLSAKSTTSVSAEVSGTVEKVYVSQGDSVKEGDTLFTLTSEDLTDTIAEKKEAMEDAYTAYKQAKKAASSSSSSSAKSSSQSASGETSAKSGSSSAKSASSAQEPSGSNQSSSGSTGSNAQSSSSNAGSTGASAASGASDASAGGNGTVRGQSAQDAADQGSTTTQGAQTTQASVTQASYTLGTQTTTQTAADAGSGNSTTQAYSAYKQAKSAYEDAVANLEKLTVTAPSDGVVTSVSITTGDTVSAGGSSSEQSAASGSNSASTAAIVISDMEKMTMTVQVSEYDIANIEKGQAATVTVKAADETVDAKVLSVAATASTSSSSMGGNSGSSSSTSYYDVVLVISKPTDAMMSGMNATAEIVYESYKDALLVPAASVTTDPQGNSFVSVQGSDGQSSRVSVTVLGGNDETSAVEGELSAGDNVVVTYQISDGDDSSAQGGQMGGMGSMGGMMGGMRGDSSGQRGGEGGFGGGNGGNGGGPGGGTPPSGGPGGAS